MENGKWRMWLMAITIAISTVVSPSPAMAGDLEDFFKNPIKAVGGFVRDNQALVGLGLYWLVNQQNRNDNRKVAKATVETRRAEANWYVTQTDQVKRQMAQTDQLFNQAMVGGRQKMEDGEQGSEVGDRRSEVNQSPEEPEIIRPIDGNNRQPTTDNQHAAASRLAFVGHRLNLPADDQFGGWRAVNPAKDRIADFDFVVVAIDGLPKEVIVNVFADDQFLFKKEAKVPVSQEELAMKLAIATGDLPPTVKEVRLETLVFWPEGSMEEAEFSLLADPTKRQAETIPGLAALPSLTRQTFAKNNNDDGRQKLAALFKVQKNEVELAWRQQ